MTEIENLVAMIAAEDTAVLQAKLQRLHKQKLTPFCLFNPSNRDKVDQVVGLIGSELRKRRAEESS